MSLKIVFLLSLVLVVLADQTQFRAWMQEHNKAYSDSEYAHKYANFMENVRLVEYRNSLNDGLTHGLNQYSDLSAAEFKEWVLMKPLPFNNSESVFREWVPEAGLAFDWRNSKAVTDVKNQGQCGSCWAFSATETIESSYILAGKATAAQLNLGPQQIVDCDSTDGGCNGGWPEKAMAYVVKAGGQEGATDYPYTAKNGACHFQANLVKAKIGGSTMAVKQGDESGMQSQLQKLGPLSICLDASKWQTYRSGIMTASQCCSGSCQLDHAVQLVGFNTDGTTPYWIVRNSWGTSWGNAGYIWIEMGKNACGITNHVYWATQ